MKIIKVAKYFFESGPPDFDKAVLDFWNKVLNFTGLNFKSPQKKLRSTFYLLFIVFVLFYFFLGFYLVAPAQRAVVVVLGRFSSVESPGLHWCNPALCSVYTLNVEHINSLNYHAEMLTQDENYVDMDVAVMYKIADPFSYLFNVKNPKDSFYHATASAVRQAVGHTGLEKIITVGRENIRLDIENQLNKLVDLYNLGIVVVDVKLQEAKPPVAVQQAFDDAICAREDEQKFINKAMAYKSEVLPKAQGEAFKIIKEAEAYKNSVIQRAKSEAVLFKALLPSYVAVPPVQRTRLKSAIIEELLTDSAKIVVKDNNKVLLPMANIEKIIMSNIDE